jgi:O-antigen ligase
MDREAWDNYLEKGILGLVLGILVVGPLCFGAVHAIPMAGIQALTGVVLLLWAGRLWIAPKPRLLFPPVCWGVLAFVVYAAYRYATADIEYVARLECLRVLTYAALFFAVLNNLHRQENARLIVYSMVFLAMCLAALGVYQFATNTHTIWHLTTPFEHRGTGTYINANHFAGFLELILPLALAHAMLARAKILPRLLFGYASLVIMAGIATSVSRGAWLSTLVVLLCLGAVLMSYRPYRIPIIVFLLLALTAGGLFVKNSFSTQLRLRQLISGKTERDLDDSLRFSLWQPAVEIWKENPWLGAGPAHFDHQFRKHRPPMVQKQPHRVHNDYLNTLADWGIIGLTLVTACWGLLAWGLARTWSFVRGSFSELGERKGSNKFAVVLGTSLGLLAILLHSVVDFNMHIPANAILVVVWMALLASHIRFATERFWFSHRVLSRCFITLLITAVCIVLAGSAWKRATEDRWVAQAQKAELYSQRQLDCLRKAHSIEPRNPATTYALGETLRFRSQNDAAGNRAMAEEALKWYELGMQLNPWDGYNSLRYAMCLVWLDRAEEAWPYLSRAEALDPQGYYMLSQIGICYMQADRYAAARPWLQRSVKMRWGDNPVAHQYLKICETRLEQAAGLSTKLKSEAPVGR